MNISTLPVNTESLTEYSTIPSRFEVKSTLSVDLLNDGFGGIALIEEVISPPYVKDYDVEEGEGPTRWTRRYNTSNWALFIAHDDGDIPVGGATIAFQTPEIRMFGGRSDVTVLWDIRVHPDHRRSGIGTALFTEAAKWSRERNCKYLKVETQNVNVPACRFYAQQGCLLGEINRFAYTEPHVAHETMLVWYLAL